MGGVARAAAGHLVIASIVPVEAGLDGVRSRNLGDVVGDVRSVRHFAEGIRASSRPVRSVGIRAETDRGIVPAVDVGNLRHVLVLENARHLEAELARIHHARVGQMDRVDELGLGEHEFVGQRRAEHVHQAGVPDIGPLRRILRGWIRQRSADRPPNADGARRGLSLAIPAHEQLRVLADVVVAA